MVALQNKLSKLLKVKHQIEIDGIKVNTWQEHKNRTKTNALTWDKIISYLESNANLSGENGNIVFTGMLQISRQKADKYATKLGFKVHDEVSLNTDLVIIGSENISPSKIERAKELNNIGQGNIKVIYESTFLSLVSKHLIEQ